VITSIQALKEREIENHDKILGLQKHGLPLNTLIEAHDLPYEKTPWGDEPLVSVGLAPISVVIEQSRSLLSVDDPTETPPGKTPDKSGFKPGKPGSDSGSLDGGHINLGVAFEKMLEGLDVEREKAERSKAVRRAIWARWWASYSPLRKQAAIRFRAFITRQGDDVIARMQATPLTRKSKSAGRGFDRTKASVVEWLDRVLVDFKTVEDGRLDVVARFEFKQAASFGGQQAIAEVTPPASADTEPFDFQIDNPAMREHLKKQTIRVRDINNTTANRLRRTLSEGFENGETMAELTDRVAKSMGIRAGKEAARIAQTEIHEAVGAGRNEGFKQVGIRAKRWWTSQRGPEPDGPVRKSHYNAERFTASAAIPFNQKFKLRDPETGTVSECDYPGQGTLPPGERIYCSCVQLAALAVGKSGDIDQFSTAHYEKVEFLTWHQFQARARKGSEAA
ncbi:MAG: hypothetical protein GXP29_01710, partial [Planctomycetes bacterium]|nr:hypothetical protein [Planctomycetota bacterium]